MSTYIKINNNLVSLSKATFAYEGNNQMAPVAYLRKLYWFPQEVMLIAEIDNVWYPCRRPIITTEHKIVDGKDKDLARIALCALPFELGQEVYEKCIAGRSRE